MSRESSREDLQYTEEPTGMAITYNGVQENHGDGQVDFAGQLSKSLGDTFASSSSAPPSSWLGVKKANRPASKSISSANSSITNRPTLNLSKRTKSYHQSPYSATPGAGPSSPSPHLLPSPIETPGRNVLKRRTSTPSLAKQYLPEDDELMLPPSTNEPASPSAKSKGKDKATETRARSTSTSIAYPPSLAPTATIPVSARPPSPLRPTLRLPPFAPQWSGLQVTPASPEEAEESWRPPAIAPRPTFFSKAKDLGETSLSRFAKWVKPSKKRRVDRRISEDDSEKGMSEEDGGDPAESLGSVGTTRTSVDSLRHGRSRFWFSDGDGEEDEDGGYFSLPPTPPEEKDSISLDFAFAQGSSLPTPALSTRSLSKSRPTRRRPVVRRDDNAGSGWLRHLLRFGSGTKTGQVIRDLGWTVGILAALFFVTGGIALWLIKGMPM
jgi:hypothetical protein